MKLHTPFLILTILLSGTNWVSAQEATYNNFEFPYKIDVYDLPMSKNGIAYRIYVRYPLNGIDSTKSYSSFYFLDPLSLFVPASSMTSNLEYFNYLPEAFYIGIGYQNEADGVIKSINRIRDYTPTKFIPNKNHFLFSDSVKYTQSGGSGKFIEVIESQIIPFLEKFYPLSKDRVIVGKSYSGLAVAHIFLSHPALFTRYLIISPSLWWDDYLLKREDRFIMKAIDNIDPKMISNQARVYIAVGDKEENFGLVSDSKQFVKKLNAIIPGANIHFEVLKEEIHESIFPHAFMRGIQALYLGESGLRKKAIKINWND